MGPFRGPYRGSPLRDPCWWAVATEVAAHWEEVLMGPFRGGTHNTVLFNVSENIQTDAPFYDYSAASATFWIISPVYISECLDHLHI